MVAAAFEQVVVMVEVWRGIHRLDAVDQESCVHFFLSGVLDMSDQIVWCDMFFIRQAACHGFTYSS